MLTCRPLFMRPVAVARSPSPGGPGFERASISPLAESVAVSTTE